MKAIIEGDIMANKKKTTHTFSPTFMLIGLIVILALGFMGFQIPSDIQQFFGVHDTAQPSAPTSKTTSQTGDNPGPIEHGHATFTKSELKDSKKGWITYGDYDKQNRPTTAEALIKKDMVNTGTSAKQEIKPPGFISGLDPHNHSRGHLIGRQMGGSGDDPRNLVTLYQNPVNTPYMTKYENMVRKAADNGETIRYRVAPVYDGNEPMPVAVHMEGQTLGTSTINFNVTIENKK